MKATGLEPSAEEAMKSQIMKLTNVSSSTSAYILQALLAAQEKDRLDTLEGDQGKGNYELNPADVIDEEDLEESAGDQTLRQLSQTMKKVASMKKLDKLSPEKGAPETTEPTDK